MFKKLSSWQSSVLEISSTLSDAIQNLEETANQIVIIVDTSQRLLGTISDGDIRRAVVKNNNLETNVSEFMNTNPIKININEPIESILNILRSFNIRHVPIVSESGVISGIYHRIDEDHVVTRDNHLLVMAGGKGTRLLPLTENTPKPMLHVDGKPILEHIILRAKKQGFKNITISIGHLADVIVEYFENGSKWDLNINYIKEEYPLGTAGALSLLETKNNLPVVVTNGDIVTSVDYGALIDFHVTSNCEATIASKIMQWSARYGVLEVLNDRVVNYKEKPNFNLNVNAGIYVFDQLLFKNLPINAKFDMNEFISYMLKNEKKVMAYPLIESWTDVGVVENLNYLNSKMRSYD